MKLIERVNPEKLLQVQRCDNIPIHNSENEEDKLWRDALKKRLLDYAETNEITYSRKHAYGRWQGNGLQKFPGVIRNYLCGEFYVDIDIQNCHPVILEHLFSTYLGLNRVPIGLLRYNEDRASTIKEYCLETKLGMIILINSDNWNCIGRHKDLIDLHQSLFNDLVPLLKEVPRFSKIYSDCKIKDKGKGNVLGSFIAHILQDIENDILMCIFKKCKLLMMAVSVLVYDGLMITKESFNADTLPLLENEVFTKLNYKIKLVQKSMETDWFPMGFENPDEEGSATSLIKHSGLYKAANKLLQIDLKTNWDISEGINGSKFIPNCQACLVRKCTTHDDTSLFIHNDKTKPVIKQCSNCGPETMNKKESKKIQEIFLTIKEDNSIFQGLVEDLLTLAAERHFRREKHTGIVYQRVKKYAYKYFMDPMDFLNEIFINDSEFMSNVNNMDNLIKFMKQYNNTRFPFIEYNKDYLGFSNGILNIVTCEFTAIRDDDESDCQLAVWKYFDQEFKASQATPLLDRVLNYQFEQEEEVVEFIYACLGRMFGIRDNYQFMLYLLGLPGCGKSLILNVISACFNNVGAIGSSFEEKFGLSFLYDKDIIICDDVPKDMAKTFPQQTFQSCISGGTVPIAVKGGKGFSVLWKIPMLWSGNWFPNYTDKGQISRRMLIANFEKPVINIDPTLEAQIIASELPAFMYRCLLGYKNMRSIHHKDDVYSFCPEYFNEQRKELRIERNPLYKFLSENTRFKENNEVILDDIKQQFKAWLGLESNTLIKYPMKDIATFNQVNNRYEIVKKNICKSCRTTHKKGCCSLYDRKSKTSALMVLNIEFGEEDYES